MTDTVIPLRRVTVGDEQAHAEWVRQLPDQCRAVVERLAPTARQWVTCYRLTDTDGHYRLGAVHEHEDGRTVTLTVAHITGPGSRLVAGELGIGVFGIDPTHLVVCGCGQR